MNTRVQTSLRIDKDAYQNAKSILKSMGMNFSEAVNIFTAMIVENKGLPFEIKMKDTESEDLNKRLKIAMSEVAMIENKSSKSVNARDFINEL